ncbi:3'-5' exonuclease [Brockia lithotrophica]|nr:exonuclease domain-containing protein [Brockia lithotrophica]
MNKFIRKIYENDITNDDLSLLVVDVETTGLNYKKDQIIEFAGIVLIANKKDKRIKGYIDAYAGAQEPSIPIKKKVSRITGINREDVVGFSLNLSKINELFKISYFVIAHNAIFDKRFIERLPNFRYTNKIWLDTLHINWKKLLNIKNNTLNEIKQFFNIKETINHSALGDAISLSMILQEKIDGVYVLSYLLTDELIRRIEKYKF